MSIGETIEEIGWEQGCFLPPELVHQLQPIGTEKMVPSADFLYVIVSQSCDVVHDCLQAEPWCEVLQLQKIARLESLCENGRNPRKYHLNVSEKGTDIACGTTAKDRYFLKRDLLANVVPLADFEINKPRLQHLTKWLANRYIRPALPTAFNKRLMADKKKQKKLKDLLTEHHYLFRDFYLRLNTYDELIDPDAIYKIKVLLVAHDRAYEKSQTEIESFKKQFRELFKDRKGVHLEDVVHLAEGRTSIRLLDNYVTWDDFDYLTIPGEEPMDAPATT